MNDLRKLVNEKIDLYSNREDIESLECLKKFEIIKEILKDDACFFKMSFDDAYSILCELGVDKPIEFYKDLIKYSEFKIKKDNLKFN